MDDETAYFNFVLVKYDRFILQPDRLAEAFLYFCQGLGVSKFITYALQRKTNKHIHRLG